MKISLDNQGWGRV